ncbi:hypothetical protein ACMGGX_19280 [Enterobacter sp. BNK-29]|uniref:hypothetical protein n=1 Tax=Enterobacter sp. BNK-29 TaxID=3376164 RepID=UPI003B5013C4
MHIVRVHQNSKALFDHFLCKLKIPTNKARLISSGAYDDYGPYINKVVSVYGFMDAEKSLYDQLEAEVQNDSTAKQSYKSFSKSEFFF